MKRSHSRAYYVIFFILLPALVFGAALYTTVQEQLRQQTFRRLDNSAQVLADLASSYYTEGTLSNMLLNVNLYISAQVSDADVMICDDSGVILLCSDAHGECTHRGLHISGDYLQRVISCGLARDSGLLQGLYDQVRHISAAPVYARQTGAVVGIVMVSTPVAEGEEALQWVMGTYGLASFLLILFSMMAMGYFSQRHEHPLREMSKTTSAFGHGDLNARVTLTRRYPEEVEELALSINNMASSLQKSEYSRQEFVANVSHELKTPMTTISGYVDGMLDGTIPPDHHRKYMQIVSDETKRLSRLVRSMLDISQLQGEGGIPAEKLNRFDVEECIGMTLILFEQKILAKNIQVAVDMPEHQVYTIANQDYISQVVYNLVDNAVKFCPDGGRLTLSVREGTSKMFVSIANDGPTIPPEELSLLFDRFHKLDKSRTRKQEGWGLGLYIVKTIVGLHGEDISVTSADDRTEFTFTLPLYN